MVGSVRAVVVGAVLCVAGLAVACTAAPPPPLAVSSAPPSPASSSASPSSATTTASAAATPATPDGGQFDDYLTGMAQQQQFRGAVEVRRGADVLLRKGYGPADVEAGTPITADTRFEVGSVTKQFTAVAVLRLQDQGKLTVTAPVCSYVPGCPAEWTSITVEQLLVHTSGLYNYTEANEAEAAPYLGRVVAPAELISYVASKPLDFEPGTRWKYSNSGYVLLGLLVERLSGMDYGTFLRRQLFDALEMRDTRYDGGVPPRAKGYTDWATPGEDDPSLYYAAGGLLSTTGDLAKWNAFLLSGKPALLTAGSLAEMLKPHTQIPGTSIGYGYGIEVHDSGPALTYYHGGLITGFRAANSIRPSSGLSVTVLTNLATVNPAPIAAHLAELADGI
ncbi:MAG: serine hydrolase domain-containing protein [Umezawaea sp.]